MSIQKELTIRNKMGMHARPAAQFVKRASKYQCDVWVEKDDEPVNGKSIMGLMMLAAGRGETIKIIADWGILQVNEGGCLFDWRNAVVSGKAMKKENNRLTGDGWEIELAENWILVPEGRVYRLIKEKELKIK